MERYSVEQTIGEGSYGRALLVRDRETAKRCVMKRVSLSRLDAKARVARVELAYQGPESPEVEDRDAVRDVLHTRFHHVPSLEETLNPGSARW